MAIHYSQLHLFSNVAIASWRHAQEEINSFVEIEPKVVDKLIINSMSMYVSGDSRDCCCMIMMNIWRSITETSELAS